MKTGWVIAGVVVIGGLIYLMTSGRKVVAGSQTRVSNGTGFIGEILGGVKGALSGAALTFNIGGGPPSSSPDVGRGPGDPAPYQSGWGDINGDGGITPDYRPVNTSYGTNFGDV